MEKINKVNKVVWVEKIPFYSAGQDDKVARFYKAHYAIFSDDPDVVVLDDVEFDAPYEPLDDQVESDLGYVQSAWEQCPEGTTAEAFAISREETRGGTSSQASRPALADQMDMLLWRLRNEIKQGERDHSELCRMLADSLDLWDTNDCFPTWLSRVVEGELNDFHAEEGWWYVNKTH